jgi:hypothetical protein
MCFVKILLSKVKLSHYHHANAKRERIYSSYSFLTSALNEGERSASHPGHILSPGQDPPSTHWIWGWVGLRAFLDTEARGKMLCLYQWWNPVIQSVDRHDSDWSTTAPKKTRQWRKYKNLVILITIYSLHIKECKLTDWFSYYIRPLFQM